MSDQTTLLVWQGLLALCAIGAAVCGFAIFAVKARIDRGTAAKHAMTGVIAPSPTATTPVPPIAVSTTSPSPQAPKVLLDAKAEVWPQLEIGVDSGSIFVWAGPANTPMIRFGADNNIVIVLEEGVVKLSATIRDKTGAIIARLVKNEWKVNPNHSWDRNYSADAVEVMDDAGTVVLQAIALPDRVQFAGRLYSEQGSFAGFGCANPQTPGAGALIVFKPEDLPEIPAIFRYPSMAHLGERVR